MHAHLALQQAVGVFTVDFEGRRLDARALAFQSIGFDNLKPVALRPAVIHAQKHLGPVLAFGAAGPQSEEHTSELQSHVNLVCRLLLEKKKHIIQITTQTYSYEYRCSR